MTNSAEIKRLFALMLPILLTQICQAGYGFIDSLMAGQWSNQDLAAVAIGAGLWLPILLLVNGIMVATTPLVSEAVGAKQLFKVTHIVREAIWVALALGLLGIILLRFMPLLFVPLQVPATLYSKTTIYLHGIAWGLPAATIYMALRGYAESLGHPKVVTFFSFLGVLLCVPFNAAFIYGVQLWGYSIINVHGGVGTGIASALVLWIVTVLLAVYLSVSKHYAHLRIFSRWEKPDFRFIKQFLQLGLPIGAAIFFEASLFCIASLILSPLGENVVAAHQISLSITSLIFMLPLALGLALTIRVGQLYGAKDWSTLKRVRRLGFILACMVALLNIIILCVARVYVVGYFTHDAAIVLLAQQLLFVAIFYQIFDAWQVTGAGILRGIQDTSAAMWLTLISYWVIALPLGTYLSRYTVYGAAGFWFALVVSLGFAAVLLAARIHFQMKKLP